jgi:hypothetical protein
VEREEQVMAEPYLGQEPEAEEPVADGPQPPSESGEGERGDGEEVRRGEAGWAADASI